MVSSERIRFQTKGDGDIINITDDISQAIGNSGLQSGIVVIFVSGSTAGVTTIEYEPGLVADMKTAFERLVPRDIGYRHDARWGDGNGHSHVRASLLGASLTIPFESGRTMLGTWQQVVVIDFDNRSRTREVTLQIIGER